MKRANSPYRLDKLKVIQPETDSLLAIIPMSARNMILSVCEYMNWPAFWNIDPPTPQEWDNIQLIIAELEQAMSTAISVQSLDDRLTEIKTAIEGIESGGGMDCCEDLVGAINALALPVIAASLPAPSPGDDGIFLEPSQPLADTMTITSDACGLARSLAEGMQRSMSQLAPIANIGIAGIVLATAAIGLAAWPLGLVGATVALSSMGVLGIWSGLLAFATGGLSSAATYIADNLDEIVCEALGGMTEVNTGADIKAILDGLTANYPPAAAFLAAAIYTNGYAANLATAEWAGGDCDCEIACGDMFWNFGVGDKILDCWVITEGLHGYAFVSDGMELTSWAGVSSSWADYPSGIARLRVNWYPVCQGGAPEHRRVNIAVSRREIVNGVPQQPQVIVSHQHISGVACETSQDFLTNVFTVQDGYEYSFSYQSVHWSTIAIKTVIRTAQLVYD